MEKMYHLPVLAEESISALNIQPNGVYIDATFGGGGHSKLILEQLGSAGKLFGFDQDQDALANVLDDTRFTMVPGNFKYLRRFLKMYAVRTVDGILADLGVSSHQLDEAKRGFSYRFDAKLDMRMNQEDAKTAALVLNTYDADSLQRLFSEYGEVRNAKTLTQRILSTRQTKELETINDLLNVLDPLVIGQRWKYLSQVFQALRMEVNDEVKALEDFLKDAFQMLKPGGRLVVIAYHSIEDRCIKQFLKTGSVEGNIQRDFYGSIFRPFQIITKKAIEPSAEELVRNSRARSAKMRVGERLAISDEHFEWG